MHNSVSAPGNNNSKNNGTNNLRRSKSNKQAQAKYIAIARRYTLSEFYVLQYLFPYRIQWWLGILAPSKSTTKSLCEPDVFNCKVHVSRMNKFDRRSGHEHPYFAMTSYIINNK